MQNRKFLSEESFESLEIVNCFYNDGIVFNLSNYEISSKRQAEVQGSRNP